VGYDANDWPDNDNDDNDGSWMSAETVGPADTPPCKRASFSSIARIAIRRLSVVVESLTGLRADESREVDPNMPRGLVEVGRDD